MGAGADGVGMDSTHTPTPTTPTSRLLVQAAVVLAALALVFIAWSTWQSNEADTQHRQECIVAQGRYGALGRHTTPPGCE